VSLPASPKKSKKPLNDIADASELFSYSQTFPNEHLSTVDSLLGKERKQGSY